MHFQVLFIVNLIDTDHFCAYIGSSDFESLAPISVENVAEVRLFTSNDEIALEYNDRIILTFTPDNPMLIPGLDAEGEYVRDSATVHIIDDDSKCCLSLLAVLNPFSYHRAGD